MNSGPKRRILIVTQHFYPEIEATAQLMTDLAIDLVDRGLDVTVIAALPYFLTPKHTSPPSKEEYKGITIMRVYTTRFNLTNIFGRIPNWCSFHITSLLKSIFVSRPDVVLLDNSSVYCIGWDNPEKNEGYEIYSWGSGYLSGRCCRIGYDKEQKGY